jgi:hypothetical protein
MPVECLAREGFTEFILVGAIEPAPGEPGLLHPLPANARVLVDFSGVTKLEMPVERCLRINEGITDRGHKVAAVAPHPVVFGLARQGLQLAGVAEGRAAAVFRSRDDAVAWLLADDHASAFHGSGRPGEA